MMNLSPRGRWILDNVQGKQLLDVGYVAANQKATLHHILHDAFPDMAIFGADFDAAGVRRLGYGNSVIADGKRLPFADASFDAVLLAEIIEHMFDARLLMREAARVLEPGGRLYITTPSPYSLNRWARYWLLHPRPHDATTVKRYLGAHDHCIFWEPLSLCNTLDDLGLTTVVLATKNHRIPLLARFWRRLACVDIVIFPFNRLGAYTCLVAEKR